MYSEIEGNLITFALEGKFDVITHGCNCMCTMGAGIAPQMAVNFDCNVFPMEKKSTKGDINKLGQIDWEFNEEHNLFVVNSYTQFNYGKNHTNGTHKPLDYEALTLCMRKINYEFKGKHIGLPQIGCGLAGGDWSIVKSILQKEFTDCDVTVVIYKK